MCDKNIDDTFQNIYLLDLAEQKPIIRQSPSAILSVFIACSIQDNLICNIIVQLLRENMINLESHHWNDNRLNVAQCNKRIPKSKTNKLQPFSLDIRENGFYPYEKPFFLLMQLNNVEATIIGARKILPERARAGGK